MWSPRPTRVAVSSIIITTTTLPTTATRTSTRTIQKLFSPRGPASFFSSSASSRSCVLEVERKFRRLAVPQLTQHGGRPPFNSLLALPTQTVRDTYYDDDHGLLSSAGVWVRRRNGSWEAKVKKWGTYNNSRFEELSEVGEIAACVERVADLRRPVQEGKEKMNDGDCLISSLGLVVIADLVTTRETWIADGEFHIVRDRMVDFGHEVGEVELQRTLEGNSKSEGPGSAAAAPSEEEKRAEMQRMDESITEFMRRYSWAFAKGPPVGKLTAYFEKIGKKPR